MKFYMSQICGWLKRHHKSIAFPLWLLALLPAFAPAWLNYSQLQQKKGSDEGRQQIYRTQQMVESVRFAAGTTEGPYKMVNQETAEFLAQGPVNDLQNYYQRREYGIILQAYWDREAGELGHSMEGEFASFAIDDMENKANGVSNKLAKMEQEADKQYNWWQRYQAEKYFDEHGGHWYRPPTAWDYAKLTSLLIGGYIGLCLWTAIVLLIPQAKINGFKLWCEICSGRLPLTALFHPFTMLAYPWGDPREQLRKALNAVISFLSLIMVQSFTAATALTQQTDSKKSETNSALLLPAAPAVHARFPLVITVSTETLSKYVGLDGAVFFNHPVQWSQLLVASTRSGLSAGMFTSVALADRSSTTNPNFGNEVDLWTDYSHKLGGGWTIDAGPYYVDSSPVLQIPRGDVLQSHVGIQRPLAFGGKFAITPYLTVRRFDPLRGNSPGRGWLTQVGSSYNWQPGKRFTLSGFAELSKDSGVFGNNSTGIFRSWINPHFKAGHFEITPLEIYMDLPLRDPHDGRTLEAVLGPRVGANW
jgi:hypothetical protein